MMAAAAELLGRHLGAGCVGYAEIDATAGAPRPAAAGRRQRILEGMRNAVERGAGLTRQLLAFARRQPPDPEPVDPTRRLEGMRELLDRSLRGDVQVGTRLGRRTWPVEVDPSELALAVLNLCLNARDAMPNGGTIAIVAENVPGLRRPDLQGDFVRLAVEDGGAGMAPEVAARAFEPFFTTKEPGQGSGLGLAQVYGFARQSGGAAAIESEPGRGTAAATLLLPRSAKRPPVGRGGRGRGGAPPAAAPNPAGGAPAQVLLVEDDAEVAALATEMLGSVGFGVTRVAGAAAALGALKNGRPIDIVLSDVMMPGGMGGGELAREIRRRRPGLPVVLTAGFAGAAGGAEAEGSALLLKPYLAETPTATRRAPLAEARAAAAAAGGNA